MFDSNGYAKLSNGFIIQWGVAIPSGANTTIELPTSFTTTNYKVVATQSNAETTKEKRKRIQELEKLEEK